MDAKTKKKYLVTGGAGFIGSNIAKTLEAQGHEVTVLDDFSKNGHFKNLIGFKGDVITADLFEYMPTDMYFILTPSSTKLPSPIPPLWTKRL